MLDLDALHKAYEAKAETRRVGKTTALLVSVVHQAESGNIKNIAVLAVTTPEAYRLQEMIVPMLEEAGLGIRKMTKGHIFLENKTEIIFISEQLVHADRLAGIVPLVEFHDKRTSIALWG